MAWMHSFDAHKPKPVTYPLFTDSEKKEEDPLAWMDSFGTHKPKPVTYPLFTGSEKKEEDPLAWMHSFDTHKSKPFDYGANGQESRAHIYSTPLPPGTDLGLELNNLTGIGYENAYSELNRVGGAEVLNKATGCLDMKAFGQLAMSHGASLSEVCDKLSKVTGCGYENAFLAMNRIEIK